jgi:hypothetical protein
VKATQAKTYQPPDVHHMAGQIMRWLDELRNHERNKVISGLTVVNPTTGSSQLTGTGDTDWNCDITAGVVTVDGVAKSFDAVADFDVHSGSYLTGFANGSSCIAAIVAKNDGGTVSVAAVVGTPATTGSQVAPTDSEIQTELGAGVEWVKLAEITLNRTADTTVTETQDSGKRPILSVTADPSFADL